MSIILDKRKGISTSKKNDKMDPESAGKVISISLPPGPPKVGGSCNPSACKYCWRSCYNRMMTERHDRPYTLPAYQRNFRLFKKDPDWFFDKIYCTIKLEDPDLFRFFVGGDFPTQRFVDMSIELGKQVSTPMLAFTKTHFGDHNFSFKGRSSNFEVVLSAWPGMPIRRRRGMKVAWMQDCTEHRIPKKAFKCDDNCIKCKYCWDKTGDVWFPIHGRGLTKKKQEAIEFMKVRTV